MKKSIICFGVIMLIALCCAAIMAFATPTSQDNNVITTPTIMEEITIPVETTVIEETEPVILDNVIVEQIKPSNLEEANKALEDAIFRRELAISICEGLLSFGYEADHPAVVMAQSDVENTEADYLFYKEWQETYQIEENWRIRAQEYPVATKVWLYMKNELGFNDIVCAGIMGNMMAECGGCWTSDLDWDEYTNHSYGLIQWLGGRRRELFAKYGDKPGIEEQLQFMYDELFGTHGVTEQVTEYQLKKIMDAETPEECAFAFATYFERCSEEYRAWRKGYARRAYEYFVD